MENINHDQSPSRRCRAPFALSTSCNPRLGGTLSTAGDQSLTVIGSSRRLGINRKTSLLGQSLFGAWLSGHPDPVADAVFRKALTPQRDRKSFDTDDGHETCFALSAQITNRHITC